MGDDGLGPEIKDLTLYYLISEIIFLLGKYPVLHIYKRVPYEVLFSKTYTRNRRCPT